MVYMDTPYEERNLGVTSCKFLIDQREDPANFLDEIRQCGKQYQEAQVEAGNIRAVHALEEQGFRFMETMVGLEANRSQLTIPKVARRFVGNTSYEASTPQEIQYALDYIRSREIFSTDKIALNPAFGLHAAGKRYALWMQDMMEESGVCYSFKYKGEVFGFEVVRMDGPVANLCLGTAYPDKGAGTALIASTSSIKHWMNADITKLRTEVSSNNLGVLKNHEMYGLKVSRMHYVLSRVL